MRQTRSLMILSSTLLLIPFSPAYSAEIELPRIQTTCRSFFSTKPIPVEPPLPSTHSILGLPNHSERDQIQALMRDKQWNRAWSALQDSSSRTQVDLMPTLLELMFREDEVQRATQYLIRTFPIRSELRADGTGIIAAELIKRDQSSEAIKLLKTLPQPSSYSAFTPVARSFVRSNQIEKIVQVVELFPEQRSDIWTMIGYNVPFEPEQAQQVASLIKEDELRTSILNAMADYWLSSEFDNPQRDVLKGWKIANAIDDCKTRIYWLDKALMGLHTPGLQVTMQQVRALDELAALINTATLTKPARTAFQIQFARLNISYGRKAQARKLLEQLAESLKTEPALFRMSARVSIAEQYQFLNDVPTALQFLDLALKEADAIAQRDASLREMNLRSIARLYRSLNQPQKASAIEKTLLAGLTKKPVSTTDPDIRLPSELPAIRIPSPKR